ncbi:MAG: hypothetical protein BKP49_06890 [Treponema sp. CETP13]|nr:MAG: hypothetical protein BKP49_06890 [Treponema sp. CETP13]
MNSIKTKLIFQKKFLISIILFSLVLVVCTGCKEKAPEKVVQTKSAIGTICTITLYEQNAESLFDEIFAALDLLEQHVSVNIATSDIAKINDAAGTNNPITVNDDTLYILQAAIKYASLTGGAFDPSIGPLVKLWAIGTDKEHVPSQAQIDSAKALVDYTKIQLDPEKKTVYLPVKGMSLDLGGIAKGYAADMIVQILQQHGVSKAIIDLGGNIYAYGAKAPATNTTDAIPWKVGIKNPFDSTGAPIIVASLINKTVVTSGVYERFFIKDGVRYHHLIDRKTGYPEQNGLMSATIITNSSMMADALSTAVFILGKEKGIALLEKLNTESKDSEGVLYDVQGLCVDKDKNITATSNLRLKIAVIDSSFSLE